MHYDADTLDDYLRGQVEPRTDAAIHDHLQQCDACMSAYNDAASLRDWIRSAAQATEREMPATIAAAVMRAVRAPDPAPSLLDRLRSAWRPLVALPAAAALALVVYVGVPTLHVGTTDAPAVSATYYLEEHAAESAANPLADRGLVVSTALQSGSTPAALEAGDTPDAAGAR